MSYCINHLCKTRTNSIDANECDNCGQKSLLICSGKYRLIKMIGNTSQERHWEVFTGGDTRTGITQSVVIKTLRNNTDENQRLFDTEAEILRKAKGYHGIPKLVKDVATLNLDLREVNTTTLELRNIDIEERRSGTHTLKIPYFVMEYIDGLNLKDWLARNIKVKYYQDAWRWLREMTCILDYVHNLGYIHRDLKPENIILKRGENTLVLIDFGIAKHINSKVQGTNTEVGTPGYRPQEQTIREGDIGYHSDFYALGRTFFYLATGEPLSDNEELAKNWNEKTNFSNSPIIDLIEWMAKENPDERPQTTSEILYAIDILSKPKSDGSPCTHEDAIDLIKNIRNGLKKTVIRKKLNLQDIIWISIPILTIACSIGFLIGSGRISIVLNPNATIPPTPVLNPNATIPPTPLAPEELISFGDRKIEQSDLQRGDKLIPKEEDLELINKGIEHFQKEEYLDAYTIFYNLRQSAEQEKSLPIGDRKHEAVRKYANLLIYMNNAKVRHWHKIKNPKSKIHTIISAVPADFVRGQQILYGVAHAQSIATLPADSKRTKTFYSNSVNQSKTSNISLYENNIDKEPKEYLEIGIANDLSDRETVIALSKKLGEKSITGLDKQKRSVLAVVGHYSSEITCLALPAYNIAKLPIISSGSTLRLLRDNCQGEDKSTQSMFFRTPSSTQKEADGFIEYLQKPGNNIYPIILFHKVDSQAKTNEYSQDLYNAFKNPSTEGLPKEISKNLDPKNEFNLSDPNNLKAGLSKIKESQNIIMLLPDAQSNPKSTFEQAITVLEKAEPNKTEFIIISNPLIVALRNDLMKKWKGKLIGAVDWYGSKEGKDSCASKDFTEEMSNLWGGDLNRMTAQSYEAVQLLANITNRKNETRESIFTALKGSNNVISDIFKTSRLIRSDSAGDRVDITQRALVKIDEDGNKFVPIDNNQCH
jgi:eukaryotic-like serine/threonine-protein kinase